MKIYVQIVSNSHRKTKRWSWYADGQTSGADIEIDPNQGTLFPKRGGK